jgi:acetyl-CoA C-acetyltransferase
MIHIKSGGQLADVVVLEAVRSPVGKRGGGLAGVPPADLLSDVLAELLRRADVDSSIVDQVLGGCVSQVGPQSGNVTSSAWLAAGLDQRTGAATVHTQCGSSQQAFTLAYGMVAGGVVDCVVAGGVESMSQVPMTASVMPELGTSKTARYQQHYELTTQFEAADRIAAAWGIGRDDLEAFAVQSQTRAADAIAAGRFTSQLVPVEGVAVDEGPRPTTRAGLAGLKTNRGDQPDARHTAGTSSQISDGAAALLLLSGARCRALGLAPRARVVDSALIGSDPVLMLTGPIPASRTIHERNGLGLDDVDVVEINEAFASVVLAWAHELKSDLANVNVNGGAIALGHPLGATGAVLLTKCLNELERTGGRYGLITMCVGGGMGTATLIERI